MPNHHGQTSSCEAESGIPPSATEEGVSRLHRRDCVLHRSLGARTSYMHPLEDPIVSDPRGFIVTLTGQSGSGKTTISKHLQALFPDEFTEAVSHTTRAMRSGEVEGYDYYFVSDEEFEAMREQGEFLETVDLYDRKYGSAFAEADRKTATGKHAFVILEPHGVAQWKENYDAPKLHVRVCAPSNDELVMRMRLQGRSQEDIETRLTNDEKVFDDDPAGYHLVVTNDNLEEACNTIRDFVQQSFRSRSS